MSLYTQIEKHFFFTLTRKIVGNIGFLISFQLLSFWLVFSYIRETQALLKNSTPNATLVEQLATRLDSHQTILAVLTLISLVAAVGIALYMRHLFLRPIRGITEILSGITEKDGDISARLPVTTQDEIADMANSYNKFAENLRGIIDKTRRRTVSVALGSTKLDQMIHSAHERVDQQETNATQVFQSSSEATRAIDEIARHTNTISEQNSANLEEANASSARLTKVTEQVSAVSNLLSGFNDTVNLLSKNSENIRTILTMVQEFSDQTNLLALNAAIEAARAGENGRGFAVVADEVRNLSHKVNSATGEISKNISEMSTLVENTKKGTIEIQQYTESTQMVIDDTSLQFKKMVSDFEVVNAQLIEISAAIEELSITNKESHSNVSVIADLSKSIKADMDDSQKYSEELEVATEQTQELLSRFIIGQGGFENMIQTARGWANQVQQALNELAGRGINLFDVNYKPVPNTNPQKYNISYGNAYESAIQPLIDRFVKERPDFIYAVPVDKNGYLPAHHSHLSKPMTGNFETDNINSRHMKIYNNNRAEIRRAANTEPFLLQTYIRDTGEILNDLSFPLYVNGKHWGGFILGFRPEQLLEKG
ncbi:MAG: methyl-accepting chemotaxis protein [Sedimenticola thiotaurini]|uniref:Methyl-accepting chemotaxis protein n=1 Tax=Sedimenticola thiotaurini TaxID=1543721 RepID=A0A558DGK2_9GAMM|nr:methyl-accepting chemotaxis protein [Sedimenticola sp.]TVT60154.1 MAG: methyl-accepting chemotaxis protein [Sedimenticola thiotaurini]